MGSNSFTCSDLRRSTAEINFLVGLFRSTESGQIKEKTTPKGGEQKISLNGWVYVETQNAVSSRYRASVRTADRFGQFL